jgi:hypothetical protein
MNNHRRGRKPKPDAKDKVLHTRIPEQLEQQLKEHAESLGLSVSSIVRNVLLNTFTLVEDVVSDSARLAFGRLGSRHQTSEPAEPSAPLGWQRLILNLNAVCQNCNALLPRGSDAAIGIPASEPPTFICCHCLDTVQKSGEQTR